MIWTESLLRRALGVVASVVAAKMLCGMMGISGDLLAYALVIAVAGAAIVFPSRRWDGRGHGSLHALSLAAERLVVVAASCCCCMPWRPVDPPFDRELMSQ